MSQVLEGTVQQSDLGMGAWALVTRSGETYEILQPAPDGLLQDGLRVKVKGTIRPDVMTLAMLGKVLAIDTFDVIS